MNLIKRKLQKNQNEYLTKFIPFFNDPKIDHYFITGVGGSGKTMLIRNLEEYFVSKNIKCGLTSSTGISALAINGKTIHSYLNMGIHSSVDKIDYIIKRNKLRWEELSEKLLKTQVLIIDEISMISNNQLDLIDLILKKARNSNKTFGGITVILFGDFLQLPPVVKNPKELDKTKSYFIFNSKIWKELNIGYFNLNNNYRQTDKEFIKHLGKIREGKISKETLSYFKNLPKPLVDGETLTITSSNQEANEINEMEMDKINGEEYKFEYSIESINKDIEEEHLKEIKEGNTNFIIKLKKGCKVMSTINDIDNGIVNGSTGIIIDINKTKIKVKWDSEIITNVDGYQWHKENDKGEIISTFTQIPLKLAFAITIHKSQGMSLTSVHVKCRNIFENGQLYVALSRAKCPNKLLIEDLAKEHVKANEDALNFIKKTKWINLGSGKIKKVDKRKNKCS